MFPEFGEGGRSNSFSTLFFYFEPFPKGPLSWQRSCCLPGPVSQSEARCPRVEPSIDRHLVHGVVVSPVPGPVWQFEL